MRSLCTSAFTGHMSMYVWSCEHVITQCRLQTVTFVCVYTAEKDDLMMDQLLTFPPAHSLDFSTSPSSLVSVLCFVLPHPLHLVHSLTPFNKINIAYMATHCPLAINRSTCLHLFFNESEDVPLLLSLCRIGWYMMKGAITVRQLLTLLCNLGWHNVL